jgi:4-amino-4-deoxychorismate lyase
MTFHSSRSIGVDDRGLQYGDGLFETVAVRDGRPLLWDRHLARLLDGCARLAIRLSDPRPLTAEVDARAREAGAGVLKLILTRGAGGRGYGYAPDMTPTIVLTRHPLPDYPAANREQGVAVRWCAMRLSRQPRLAGLKHLNRLEQVLARAEWAQEYAEGLMLDTAGNVIEGTMSNLFVRHGYGWSTPDLGQCGVAGVMRGAVLDLAARLGIEVAIRDLTQEEVMAANGLFLTNSLIGLWPVRELAGRALTVCDTTRRLQEALNAAGYLA